MQCFAFNEVGDMSKRRRSSQRKRPTTRQGTTGADSMLLLPDTTEWQPRDSASETLQAAFLKRCIGLEKMIHLRAQLEKETNIDNFDSGPGVEDIIRDELRKLLPDRYSVRTGVINDRYGKTCGDCDIIVFNDIWFPAINVAIAHSGAESF